MSLPPPGPGAWTFERLQGYGRHVGPVWCHPDGEMALRIEPVHTNVSGRVHGGMAMGLVSMAMTQAAQRAALAAHPGGHATPLSYHGELIDSAQVGDWVFAHTEVVRTTRTRVFVSAELRCGERTLMTASAVYQIEATALRPDRPGQTPAALPAGHALRAPVDAFSAHVGAIHERRDEHGEPVGGLVVDSIHLDARGGDEMDTGMALMMADLILGRRARTVSGSVCVTVGMGVMRLAPVRLGDALEIDSHTEGLHGDTVVVTGRFRVNGLPAMSVTSLWKMVEKK
ncbi:MAG: PaaI family thioesterase [Hydrogenophaga sp.]|uniref:PaaI family thioesterase n=1 Tax=Hydrogenophaga sp. TaxID=1904254 RepID=UPI003D0EB712